MNLVINVPAYIIAFNSIRAPTAVMPIKQMGYFLLKFYATFDDFSYINYKVLDDI